MGIYLFKIILKVFLLLLAVCFRNSRTNDSTPLIIKKCSFGFCFLLFGNFTKSETFKSLGLPFIKGNSLLVFLEFEIIAGVG